MSMLPADPDIVITRNCPPNPPFMAVQYGCHYDIGMEWDEDAGLTEQQHVDDVDINQIVARAQQTGFMPNPQTTPAYLDVSGVEDLATSMRLIEDATTAFDAIPATIRESFENDPVKFYNFVQTADNDQLKQAGLTVPAKPPIEVSLRSPEAPPEVAPPSPPTES